MDDGQRLDHARVAVGAVALLVVAVLLVLALAGTTRADPSVPPTPSATPSAPPSASPTASPSESASLGPAPSIGPASQAKRTVTRTCRAVVTRYYESTDGGPFRLVRVERVPTGRLCPQRDVAAPHAGVPTAVAGGR